MAVFTDFFFHDFLYACGTQFTEGYLQDVVIYRSMGDCYTMEDNVSSSLSQLLLPNCIVQAEARPHEPFLSHHRIVMSCTSHEQINTAAAILGLINHGMSGIGVNTPPSPSGSYILSPPPSMKVPELWRDGLLPGVYIL